MTTGSQIVSIDRIEHYNWGLGCQGWHLVKSPGLSVKQERMPSATTGPPHSHRFAREFFFVLNGHLTVEVAGRQQAITAGEGISIPPRVMHRVFNASGEVADFIAVAYIPLLGRILSRLAHLVRRAPANRLTR